MCIRDSGASIAGGGRYDDLVGMFSKQDIPATGGSLGIERILLLLAQEDGGASAPPVLVTVFGEDLRRDALRIATHLRRDGAIHTDVYVADKKLGKQFKYADERGVRFVVIRGGNEVEAGTVTVKDMQTGDQVEIAEGILIDHLRGQL